jgi:hypothetical protein
MDERNQPADESENPAAEGPSPFFGNTKDILARYTHCGACGANLHFSHVTDFSRNLTQETARCPECGVQARQVVHRLQ